MSVISERKKHELLSKKDFKGDIGDMNIKLKEMKHILQRLMPADDSHQTLFDESKIEIQLIANNHINYKISSKYCGSPCKIRLKYLTENDSKTF